jgi:serine phosphatase RsbU (regulator of sigma subunit)/Tfp pilus assembly protein PilF
MKPLFAIICIFCISLGAIAQNNDSLLLVLKQTTQDTTRSRILKKMGEAQLSTDIDSAVVYFDKALKITKDSKQAEGDENIKKRLKRTQAEVLRLLGNSSYFKGEISLAVEYYKPALAISIELGDIKGISSCYNNIGLMYYYMGNYSEAMDYLLKALKKYEETNNIELISSTLSNIGLVLESQEQYLQALDYYTRALEINKKYDQKDFWKGTLINIGNVYTSLGQTNKAIQSYQEALKISIETNDKRSISLCYGCLSNLYEETLNYEKALEFRNKSLQFAGEVGDKIGIIVNHCNLADLYLSLAKSQQLEKRIENLSNAISSARKALTLSQVDNTLPYQKSALYTLFEASKLQGNTFSAIEYAEALFKVNDSLYNEDKLKALTEMQTKYESEKKQQEIEKQQLVIEKQEINNRRQRTQLNFTLGGIALLALLSFVIFSAYQQKKRSNLIITEKNAMLEKANYEIKHQRDKIHEQKKKIEDSIRYAERIQSAVIPSKLKLEGLLSNYYIIFRPKDVVSGDFYWATRINQILIITVADCTGHGVPGAFMSMLGMSYLNEIVRKKEITTPAQVLYELRNSVIEALGQTISHESQKDGMDMSLIAIDTSTGKGIWAGAGNPLWIIRNENIGKSYENPIDMVEVIKPDNMPIAISQKSSNFTDHEIILHENDRIYLFSDGIIDQFGGTEGRKFMSKQLKRIIAETANLPLNQQKDIIEQELDNWQNPSDELRFEQVDDITVLCLKI